MTTLELDFDIDLGDLEQSAKVKGSGQAKILSQDDLSRLFAAGFQSRRDRALFGICFFTGCRISEVLQLTTDCLSGGLVTFPKRIVKGKTRTKQVAIAAPLQALLDEYRSGPDGDRMPGHGYLFPGRRGATKPHLSRANADLILRQACDLCGLHGVSTHSFRRTYITQLRDKGYSPAQIQKRTGHLRRESLMPYFDQV